MFEKVKRRTDRRWFDCHPISSSRELVKKMNMFVAKLLPHSPLFCPTALVKVTIISGLLFMNKFSSCLFQDSARPIKSAERKCV